MMRKRLFIFSLVFAILFTGVAFAFIAGNVHAAPLRTTGVRIKFMKVSHMERNLEFIFSGAKPVEEVIEEAGPERPYGYYADGFGEDLQELLFDACDEFNIPYELALAVVWKETTYRNIMGDGGRSYGYMQIQKRWHWPEMEELGVDDLMDPLGNFRVGCYILRYNYDYSGTWERALTMYNTGSPGTSGYADRVLAKWNELED